MRRRGLDPGQVDHAVRLYQDGQSLARIGDCYNVDPGTVHAALRARGVRMRDTHGRDQAPIPPAADRKAYDRSATG